MPYIFKKVPEPKENAFDQTTVKMTTLHNEQSLTDLLEMFQDFLKGCGFSFDGNIEIVPHLEDVQEEDLTSGAV